MPRAAAWAATSGTALAIGPVAGGVLVDLAGWRSIFLINAPLAGVTLALTAARVVRCPRGGRTIDWPAQLLACAALGLLTDALIALGSAAGTHAGLAALAAGAAGGLFFVRERRSAAPVLAAPVLKAPGMRSFLLAAAAVNFAMSGVLFVLPLLFRHRLGLTPTAVGLAFLPMTVPLAINPILTGRLTARTGPRLPVRAGLGLLAATGLLLAVAVLAEAPYPVIAGGLVATGVGVSLALPALVTAVVTAAPTGAAGAAGGLLNAVRQVGATLGVAATGAFVSVDGSADGRGPATALILCGAVCAAALPGVIRREVQS